MVPPTTARQSGRRSFDRLRHKEGSMGVYLRQDEIRPGTLISWHAGLDVAIILGKPGGKGAYLGFVKIFVFRGGEIRQANASYLRRVENGVSK